MTVRDLARTYHADVHAASKEGVRGEEEAQLTTPVSNLFTGLVASAGLGALNLIRETRLDRTRPDFAALLKKGGRTRQKGYIELKGPSVPVHAEAWSGRNAAQWAHMKREAEILIVCNGRQALVYRDGEAVGLPADLPYLDPETWDESGLTALLRQFLDLNPTPVVSVRDLSSRLALRTADLRDRILWLLDPARPATEAASKAATDAAKGGYRSWLQHVQPGASPRDFADGASQVVAYGMVLAALSPDGADRDNDGLITVAEARAAVREFSPVLAAAFAPLIDKPALANAAAVELGALETLISAISPERVNLSADPRGEPWLYFYEDFLAVYDPDERRQAGVYYTPVAVVQAMVAMADHILVERFGKRLGFADPQVVTLDPAAGTGAFPLAVIDSAVRRATALRGAAGPKQAAANLAKSLFAFELLPGPYSVAHLRLSQRLTTLASGRGKDDPPSPKDAPARIVTAQVVLTDTLESPYATPVQVELLGDAEVLEAEQNRAKAIKLGQSVTVVIGNPPYRRVEGGLEGRGSGGWVLSGAVPGRDAPPVGNSLFADILDVAREHTIFSHHASLYNLYVYFWRWAIWKAFERHGDGPGVVAFITGASWLTGPGFVGLRKLVRELADDAWVIDLGGDNRGATPEENVFAIETPVAVVVLARDRAPRRKTPARVRYRRVRGSADAKLATMAAVAASADPLGGEWTDAPSGWMDPLAPPTGDAAWTAMPLLIDIFPWQQPGCMFNRTWPLAPNPALLEKRWAKFTSAPRKNKPALFATSKTGRSINTQVEGYAKLADAVAEAAPEPIVRYGYRSFDRHWAFNDPRLAKTDSPSLWQSSSDDQLYLYSTMTKVLGPGAALLASVYVPDKDIFRGSHGGKDVIPLYRDAAATGPNLTAGFAEGVGRALGIEPPSVEDVAAYVYALLSASAYQTRFAEALRTPGLRVPVTATAVLWRETVEAGRARLWLHTYAERFRDPAAGRGRHVPLVEGIGWDEPVTRMPADGSDLGYDGDTHTLSVGDGRVGGVRPDVWAYQVSGMRVLPKWLGYRTRKGAGRAASSKNELDRIRPETWPDDWNDELLDLIRVLTLTLDGEADLADLLDCICDGPLVEADRFPKPAAAERRPPATIARTPAVEEPPSNMPD